MADRSIVHLGADRMQISPFKSDPTVANLVPFPLKETLDECAVRAAIDIAKERGFSAAFTSAIAPEQAHAFLACGFDVHDELYLLQRDLTHPIAAPSSTRRARRSDWDAVIALDALAFEEFWVFDRTAMLDAIAATPKHRFHVTRTQPAEGYHITGLGGSQGYIQRVAVHPQAQGNGWGHALVIDALGWLQRQRATKVHVNTQVTNVRARALYERCGFELADHRLVVLRASF